MCKAIEDMQIGEAKREARGEAKGEAKGEARGEVKGAFKQLVKLVKKGLLSVDDAADSAEMTVPEFEAYMAQVTTL